MYYTEQPQNTQFVRHVKLVNNLEGEMKLNTNKKGLRKKEITVQSNEILWLKKSLKQKIATLEQKTYGLLTFYDDM